MKFPLLIIVCLLPVLVYGQKSRTGKHWEVGLNSTQLLRNLFAQNPTGVIGDYTFFVKRGTEKRLIRTHYGGGYTETEDLFGNFGDFLHRQQLSLRLGVGFEKRRKVYEKLQLVWGADVLPEYDLDRSTAFSIGSPSLENRTTTMKIGGGPILGLRYAFSKHLAVSTESSLYLYYGERLNWTGQNGVELKRNKTRLFSVSHTLPSSLYLVFNF